MVTATRNPFAPRLAFRIGDEYLTAHELPSVGILQGSLSLMSPVYTDEPLSHGAGIDHEIQNGYLDRDYAKSTPPQSYREHSEDDDDLDEDDDDSWVEDEDSEGDEDEDDDWDDSWVDDDEEDEGDFDHESDDDWDDDDDSGLEPDDD